MGDPLRAEERRVHHVHEGAGDAGVAQRVLDAGRDAAGARRDHENRPDRHAGRAAVRTSSWRETARLSAQSRADRGRRRRARATGGPRGQGGGRGRPVRFYQFHPGQGYDEINLKRTDVVFRLPPALRPTGSPGTKPVIVQGRLAGGRAARGAMSRRCKVMPGDSGRLDKAVSELAAKDLRGGRPGRSGPRRRGKAFNDGALLQRAQVAAGRGLAAGSRADTGDGRRPEGMACPGGGSTSAEHRRARALGPGPQGASGQAGGRNSERRRVQEVLSRDRAFLSQGGHRSRPPAASTCAMGSGIHKRSVRPTYRSAPADVRGALDRQLWADGLEKLLEAQAAEDPAFGGPAGRSSRDRTP